MANEDEKVIYITPDIDILDDGEISIESEEHAPEVLPVLPLKDTVIYPFTGSPLAVGQERSLRLIDDVVVGNKMVVMVAQKDASIDGAGPDDAFRIGTITRIERMMKMPDGTMRLLVQGLQRVKILEYTQHKPYLKARIELFPDEEEEGLEIDARIRNLQTQVQRIVELSANLPDEIATAVMNISAPLQLAYFVINSLPLRANVDERQDLLETSSLRAKLDKLNALLNKELEVLELGRRIQGKVQDEMSKTQREYMLREQIKVLQHELGEDDDATSEVNHLREEIEAAHMHPEAEKEAKRELDRLAKLPQQAPEYSVIRGYLEWLVAMPWAKSTEGEIDIIKARAVLDEDHYDLEKIKERIIEYLAVRKLREERAALLKPLHEIEVVDMDVPPTATPSPHTPHNREPILCFIGPPGVGKTSLGQSIARALGRKFVRMSLGGVRDEAEIRGHRRTYIGAMPGRVVQAIRRAESNDPVFMLDEVDKLGMDYRGDPSSALLEVLDPEQNKDFRDHYLDVPFDLSKVMFIATANGLDNIPPALRDRMEILPLSGYTEEEKLHIARRYLVPKQTAAHALTSEDISFSDDAILTIARDYTREAGVRNLEREIANVCRKVVKEVAQAMAQPPKPVVKVGKQKGGKEKAGDEKIVVAVTDFPVEVTPARVREYLGKPRFESDVAEMVNMPGVATGLAWTEVGGEILFIEATRMKGSKQLTITGQLGDVMRESAQAALSYVRAHAAELGIDEDIFATSDIHLHIPAGATPKDGPSAGITLTTALASLLTGRKVKDSLAMTGEITLRGKVLPIGGLKEKSLAAKRAGITTIIAPKRNARDVEEFSEELRKAMTFIYVDTMDEVLNLALEPLAPPKRSRSKSRPTPTPVEQQQPMVPVA